MIEIDNLTKTYGRNKVLNKFNLTVGNEFMTIFGSNGCGKTTLLKILSTLIKKTSGNVMINGLDIEEDGIEIRKKIGYIGHEIYLYEELTAYENLHFYSKLYNIPKSVFEKRAFELLDNFKLIHRKDDFVRIFSRGMKQRLSIARAIMHEPTILLLDEPYTGLDQSSRDVLDDFLFNSGDGKTIIMTTHNIERLNTSKRMAILSKGNIAYDTGSDRVNLEEFKEIYNGMGDGKHD